MHAGRLPPQKRIDVAPLNGSTSPKDLNDSTSVPRLPPQKVRLISFSGQENWCLLVSIRG